MAPPLEGVRVVELQGLGPAPLAGMLLADLGADVVVVHRAAEVAATDPTRPGLDAMARGKRSIGVDLKHPDGPEVVLTLAEGADAFVDPYRPGVAERLGVGPDAVLARNPRCVYGRMTGFGQEGPLAPRAGHDITYLATSGVLAHVGLAGQRPTPPLNLVGDFGGGSMLLVAGLLAGLLHAARTGEGQVVDAAMVDGSALLMTPLYNALATGFWSLERGTNALDGGAPWYDTYECADGGYVAVGAIEPQFYASLLAGLGLEAADLPDQHDQASWPALRERFAAVFATRTRDEWAAAFEGVDACVAPVLTMAEAPRSPHAQARGAFLDVPGGPVPAPAPRFSATPLPAPGSPARPGDATREVLADAGVDPARVDALLASGAVAELERGG